MHEKVLALTSTLAAIGSLLFSMQSHQDWVMTFLTDLRETRFRPGKPREEHDATRNSARNEKNDNFVQLIKIVVMINNFKLITLRILNAFV